MINAALRVLPTLRRTYRPSAAPQTSRPVPIYLAPSLDDFRNRILPSAGPCLLKGATSAWPALRRWLDFSNLRQPGSQLVVPIEVSALEPGSSTGAGYNSPNFEQIHMPYDDFIQVFMLCEPPHDAKQYVGYLAQHALLDDIPSLKADLYPPLPYSASGRGDQWRTNVWIGTAGTWTPIHRDPYHNIFCQIVGRKHIRIFPPSSADKLYMLTDPFHKNTSSIASPTPDRMLYPQYYDALEDSWETTVDSGVTLFLPTGFYHSVHSLSKSISVNFWFL